MPLYEYLCDACGHQFEVIQKFSDAPIEVCPKCGGRVQKQLSSPAIQFKGSGWYITDYARKPQADPSKSAGTSGGKKDGEKPAGDAKPAAGESGGSSASSPPSTTPSTTKDS